MKRIYRAPPPVLEKEAMDAIENDDIEKLRTLPIDLSYNHKNWRFIQDVCVRLSDHQDLWIRSNAVLGLAHTARFLGRLEKNVVKPVLLRALKDQESQVAGTAMDAIEDINRIMKWRIGGAKKRKELEAKHENKIAHK